MSLFLFGVIGNENNCECVHRRKYWIWRRSNPRLSANWSIPCGAPEYSSWRGATVRDLTFYPGFSLHTELEWLVKSGFTPIQALQSATFNPALFLAKLDKFGVVETGHAADLVLLEANPMEDIRNTRKIAAVVMAGKYYSRQELDKMLARVEEVARNR